MMSRSFRVLALVVAVLLVFSIAGCSSGGSGGGAGATVSGSSGANTVKGHVDLSSSGISPSKVKVAIVGTDIEVTLDAEGNFVINEVPAGQHTVSIQVDDGSQASYVNYSSSSSGEVNVGDISLYYCGSISGKVTSSDGSPVSGARIAVYPLISYYDQDVSAYVPFFLETQTDSNGSYSIAGIPPMECQVIASGNGFVQAEKNIVVESGKDTACDFQLSPASTTEGSVGGSVSFANSYGSVFSVPGASVTLYASSGTEALYTSVTGWDGVYNISGVAPGSYLALAESDLYGNATAEIAVAAGTMTSQNFTLQSHGATIHGKVKNSSTGQPVEGALVQIDPLNFYSTYFLFFAISDQNGEYTLNNVSPGSYTLNICKWGEYEDASRAITVTANTDMNLDIELTPSTPINTPFPTDIPQPTVTPLPSLAPFPTDMPWPTVTPLPSLAPFPTDMPWPTVTPLPSPSTGPIVDLPSNVTVILSTDKLFYAVGETVNMSISLQNNSLAPVTLEFPTAQIYDFVLTPLVYGGSEYDPPDDLEFEIVSMRFKTDALWRWSYGQAFAQVLTSITLESGEIRSYAFAWNQNGNNGSQVPSGTYNLNALITSNPEVEAMYPSLITIGTYLP